MDTLTFNTPILYRHLTFSEAKKQPILEVDLKKALDGLDMTMSQVLELVFPEMAFSDDLFCQFIELCLLLGCDYLEPIKGIGPKTAYKLMQEHGNLSEIVEHLKAKCVLSVQYVSVARLTGVTELPPEKMVTATARGEGRSGVEFKYLRNGHGKKQRNSSRIRMSPPQTRSK